MKKRTDVPDSFNFCDPADWCEVNASDCFIVNEDQDAESQTEDYCRINASERLRVINELSEKEVPKTTEDLSHPKKP